MSDEVKKFEDLSVDVLKKMYIEAAGENWLSFWEYGFVPFDDEDYERRLFHELCRRGISPYKLSLSDIDT